MFFVRTVGETGKKTYRIANVEAAYYVGKDKFTKNISIRETFLGELIFASGVFSGGPSRVIKRVATVG